MNEFSKWYLALLRKQVDEEIAYLVTNGHDNQKIYIPCMFCIDSGKAYYTCHRLNELRQFQSSIITHGSSKLRAQHERKRIGYEAVIQANDSTSSESFSLGLAGFEMKPMYPKL